MKTKQELKISIIVYMLGGLFHFILFAYDIENDRDFVTWLWLFSAGLFFLSALRHLIKYDNLD